MARTTGQVIVESIIANDVDTVFGIPGVQTYELFNALAEYRDRVRLVGARHEQACAYMAMGYAQAAGKPGVFSVVPGPGILNASAGILNAFSTSSPVVGVTGEIPTEFMGRGLGHLHELPDQLATLKTFAKWAANIYTPADAPAVVGEAFRQARSGRPGPAIIAAPWDVLTQTAIVDYSQALMPNIDTPIIDLAEIERAAALLRQARRPMIMVGSGARGAAPQIRRLARLLQAPVVANRGGRGIVSDDDPYGFTRVAGFELWSGTDVLLAIGTRQELSWLYWPDRPKNLVTINLDIDPVQHDRLQPEVALTGDAVDGVELLLQALDGAASRPSRAQEFTQIKEEKQLQINRLQPHVDYLQAIRRVLPRDGFFVEEVCQIGFSSLFAFPVYEPGHFITCGYQGNLGYGFQTALGVKVARLDKAVVSITGDGGFLYGVQELATAVQENIGLVTIVFNNSAYGNVKADQQRIYQRHYASTLQNPDFVALARSFGAQGYRASTPDELQRHLDKAFEDDKPAVIEVDMPLDINANPWSFLQPTSRHGEK